MYNYQIVNTDTDSISFCKTDGTPFTPEEVSILIKEINNLSPDKMVWEDDGYYPVVAVLKAKNYILYDGKKIKLKGSSLKSSTLEPMIKGMVTEMIEAIVFDKVSELKDIYHKYIKLASNIKDIKPWAKKVSLSATVFKSERANETKIVDAIEGSEYVEGDKVWLYYTPEGKLKLVERFEDDYDRDVFYEKLFKASQRFSTIMDTKSLFLNYSLKRSKPLLEKVLL